MGKPSGIDHNLARQQWNERILAVYPQHKIFDLAKYESHTPDGELVYQQSADKKISAMAKEYTNDGGHLNRKGQLYIAEQLLLFVAAAE